MTPNDVLRFWFEELTPEQQFKKDEAIDQTIKHRFFDLYTSASRGELFSWRENAEGRLAEIIVLDQFPRNMFRNNPLSFATDAMALTLAQECVLWRYDHEIPDEKAAFMYMPYMHSESRLIQAKAVQLFERLPKNLAYANAHRDIIEKFGRFPHRNAVLGRSSTPEELEFLKGPGSSF